MPDDELYSQCDQQGGKSSPQHHVRQVLCPETSDPTSNSEADRDEKGELKVDVTGLIVSSERENADWQQQCCNRCSLCGLLRHSIEEDEGGNQKGTASYPDHSRYHANEQAQGESAGNSE